MEVSRHLDTVVRPERERVERRERRDRVVPDTTASTVAETTDAIEGAASRKHPYEGEKGLLPLTANAVVDRIVTEHGVGMLRRKVSAPDDWHAGEPSLQRTRD